MASYPASSTLPLIGTVGATVYTDIAVTFNGSTQSLQPGQSASYTFPSSTVGAITYTYRVVPGTNLAAAVLNQLVNGIVASLPPLPVGTPFVVNTLVPLPNLPSANLPQLPPVNVAVPSTPVAAPTTPASGGSTDTGGAVTPAPQSEAPAQARPATATRTPCRAPPVSSHPSTPRPPRPSTPPASSPAARPAAPAAARVAGVVRAATTAPRCRCSASSPG